MNENELTTEELPAHVLEALGSEDAAMNTAMLQAQVQYLRQRVAELAIENANLRSSPKD